jgi:hypothetical protein
MSLFLVVRAPNRVRYAAAATHLQVKATVSRYIVPRLPELLCRWIQLLDLDPLPSTVLIPLFAVTLQVPHWFPGPLTGNDFYTVMSSRSREQVETMSLLQ